MRKPAARADRLRAHRRAERRNQTRAGGGTQAGMGRHELAAAIGTRAHSRLRLPIPNLPTRQHQYESEIPSTTRKRSWWRRLPFAGRKTRGQR